MSKSILVIDTPERCLDCPLGNSEESDGEEVYCNVLQCATYQKGFYEDEEEEELYNSKKPDWCPLKDVPEKKPKVEYRGSGCFGINEAMKNSFNLGFNACIDEILKGENENE